MQNAKSKKVERTGDTMKCLRCGKEVPENTKYCENCGFDVQSQKEYKIVYKEVDPVLESKKKVTLVDYPVLTFLFGILAMMNAIMYSVMGSIFLMITFAFIFGTCFFFSTRQTKMKLKPFREVGIIIGFLALAVMIIATIQFLAS